MRAQQFLALGGLIFAGNVAIAAKLEHDDVPNRCWDACGSVVGVSRRCDNQYDNDTAELQCICNWEAAKTQIPLCAACITQYGPGDNDRDDDDDDDENEALDLVHSCKFSTTTYNAAAATTLSASATGTTDPAATAATATATSGTTAGSGSTSVSSQGSTGTNSGAAAATSTGAAVGLTAPGVVSLAAVAGLMPLAWL